MHTLKTHLRRPLLALVVSSLALACGSDPKALGQPSLSFGDGGDAVDGTEDGRDGLAEAGDADATDGVSDGAVDAADAFDAVDGQDAVDSVDGSPDGTDDNDGAVDVEDATDAPDGLDATDAPDGLDAMDGSDGLDVMDGTDGLDVLDGADGLAATDAVDSADSTDGLDTTDGTPDGVDGLDVPDGVDATDAADGVDGVDGALLCEKTKDCDDGDPCTKDRCDLFEKVCKWEDIADCNPGGCVSDAECSDKNVCTLDTCSDTGCVHDDILCECDLNEDCDDLNVCTADICNKSGVGSACQNLPEPGCKVCTTVLANNFDGANPLNGWASVQGSTENAWQPVDKRSTSAPNSLYMGNPLEWNYVNKNDNFPLQELSTTEGIRTPGFEVPEGDGTVKVRFNLWLDIEDCIGSSAEDYDQFVVTAEPAPESYDLQFSKCDLETPWQQWKPIEFNLDDYQGDYIYGLWFYFESGNAAFNDTEGIFVDDLVIEYCED